MSFTLPSSLAELDATRQHARYLKLRIARAEQANYHWRCRSCGCWNHDWLARCAKCWRDRLSETKT